MFDEVEEQNMKSRGKRMLNMGRNMYIFAKYKESYTI